MSDFYITDLISKKQLQALQDSFARMTGMASLTTDAEGVPVTEGSNFTRFCMQYTRESKVGCERCHKCDIEGARITKKTGQATTYRCHAGLIDFAAPIMINDEIIGSFIGGQVLTERPDEEYIRKVAEEMDIPFEEYWAAISEVPILEKERIDEAANFLFETVDIMSDIAFGKYQASELQKETERVANMKTDFLANMSHEIRTPMNAVIGMAEMALREKLPPAAKEYIQQIKSSGNALLNIINDILDFSKIDSGKMDLILEEYEPLSVMMDVSSMVMTRLRDKDVEFIETINPKLPIGIVGDVLRIKQIIINLTNNAVKYTNQGFVWVDVNYQKTAEDSMDVIVAIRDSGIGIKKEDLGKLFDAFQQVDSKRNRNVEGTGLGLAITSNLLKLMQGDIQVSSEYGVGSEFVVRIPQKVTNWTPSIEIKEAEKKAVIGFWQGIAGVSHFYDDLKRMGVESYALPTVDHMETLLKMYEKELAGKDIYLFTTEELYQEKLQEFVTRYPDIQFVVECDFFSKINVEETNIQYLKKPFSTLGIATALNGGEHFERSESSIEFDFVAPEGKVLIVDDNEVNLMVAQGLLEPLKMQVTTANSGKKALDLIAVEQYDIVFMDHMMPELDGVETTHIIRRLHPELDNLPIIALTANAVGEAKKMFLAEGMNDFVAKPIEVRTLVSKVKQWMPKEKIKKAMDVLPEDAENETAEEKGLPVIGDLDVATAIGMIGNEKLYLTILEKYYGAITTKADVIRQSMETDDLSTYTIEVHALKSSSKQIGAMELSALAARLEAAGKEKDRELIREKTDEMLQKYTGYIEVFKPLFAKDEEAAEKTAATAEELHAIFDVMMEAVDNLDMDGMEENMKKLLAFKHEGDGEVYCKELAEAVENIDVDACEEIIGKWRAIV